MRKWLAIVGKLCASTSSGILAAIGLVVISEGVTGSAATPSMAPGEWQAFLIGAMFVVLGLVGFIFGFNRSQHVVVATATDSATERRRP
jgi:TRAP-type C4-dicarboxylate transport system permease small subunit